jgi:hypothetical protein
MTTNDASLALRMLKSLSRGSSLAFRPPENGEQQPDFSF